MGLSTFEQKELGWVSRKDTSVLSVTKNYTSRALVKASSIKSAARIQMHTQEALQRSSWTTGMRNQNGTLTQKWLFVFRVVFAVYPDDHKTWKDF